VLMTPDKVYDGMTDVLSASDLLALIACVGMEGCSVLLYLCFNKFMFKTFIYNIARCCR